MHTKPAILCIVVPCYNEQEVLDENIDKLLRLLNSLISNNLISDSSYLLFVDDGSKDHTWEIISTRVGKDKAIKALKFSKNYGHQNAVLAGLLSAKKHSDCCISIDADLQQDENSISEFLKCYYKGDDIVFGVRNDRDSDGFLKKATATMFYKLMNLLGVPMLRNHADFRLTSKEVLEHLEDFSETNIFLRGLFPCMGFQTSVVYHDVRKRTAGKSKYNFRRMISFAMNGITAFSIVPVRIISILGILVFIFSLFITGFLLAGFLIDPSKAVPGWASTVLPTYFLGGIQLLGIGVVGEYVGRTYLEAKRRPRYIIEEELE